MTEDQSTPEQQPENTNENIKPSFSPQGNFGLGTQQLPNSTPVLVLGILSILSCCCYGVIGLILGIIALVLAKKDRVLYQEHPEVYNPGSYKNSSAGRVCAIIGLVLNILYLLMIIFFIIMFGFAAIKDPESMKHIFENYK